MSTSIEIIKKGRAVVEAEAAALIAASQKLDDNFARSVSLIKRAKGKVVVTGVGKSGHVARKLASTFSSLGVPSVFLHSSEALHGDSGVVLKGDVVIAVSNSGTTSDVVATTARCNEAGAEIIAMTAVPKSPLAKLASAVLDISVAREADDHDLAPTCSTTVTLAVGDALAAVVSSEKGFTAAQFAFNHRGGALGKIAAAKTSKPAPKKARR